MTHRFEEDFRVSIGSEYAVAVNSATAGLHLCVDALGIGPGDRVITTPFTFTASAEIICYSGADPLFVDIDRNTMNIDPKRIEAVFAQGGKAKAIIPVHFAGQSVDLNPILEISNAHECKVIEDAAHAFPATYKGRNIGTIGDATVFSFYVTKTLATGEGGMVTTDNEKVASRIRTMRLHGINSDVFDRYTSTNPSWYYEVVAAGYKYNMTDIAAAIGVHQLRKAERFRLARQAIADRYNKAFGDLPVQIPYVERADDIHAHHLYVLQLDLKQLRIDRNQFIDAMAEEGIGTSVHFIPLHMQPYWRDRYGLEESDFPVASEVYRRVVSLPIYPKMTDRDCERVIKAVRKILSNHAK